MAKTHRLRAPSYPVGVLPAESPPEDEPAAAQAKPSAKAGVDDWRAYAASLGVDTDGLTKAQIRKAV